MTRGAGLALAAAAAVLWYPWLPRTASPDEAGFLLVAAQWQPGSSLYGDFWVDRPPGLIAIFAGADALGAMFDGVPGGGPSPTAALTALRLIAALCVAVSVLLAALIGRLAAPHPIAPERGRSTGSSLGWGAVVAAVLLPSPLVGAPLVAGEVLAVPFVLAGVATLLLGVRRVLDADSPSGTSERSGRGVSPGLLWGAATGALGVLAFGVKQNFIDVVVVTAVVLAGAAWRHRDRATWLRLAAFGGVALLGALASAAVLVWVAWARGTDPAALWDAMYTFRVEAGQVIREHAAEPTQRRLISLTRAIIFSGMPLLVSVLLVTARRGRAPRTEVDLLWPALALLAWEVAVLPAGGSYWYHYLTGMVPGLVLLAVAAQQRHRPDDGLSRWRTATVAFMVASTVIGAVTWPLIRDPGERGVPEVVEYLQQHGRPGDSLLVAYGTADIVFNAGMAAPYEHLWSLPVRVRDPELQQLTRVLSGPDRPTWVVTEGTSLATWGVDASAAMRVLRSDYRAVSTIEAPEETWTVFRHRDVAQRGD